MELYGEMGKDFNLNFLQPFLKSIDRRSEKSSQRAISGFTKPQAHAQINDCNPNEMQIGLENMLQLTSNKQTRQPSDSHSNKIIANLT